MTVSALVSGGKDSIYSAYLADCQGIGVDELLVVVPKDPDSMLFHTPNLSLVALQAETWGKRHRTVPAAGPTETDEEQALVAALQGDEGLVVAGAIASDYQWSRLHRVTFGLGRPLYTPLWGKEPVRVVQEEIAAGLDIRLVHLAAEPLTPELLGHRLDTQLLGELERRSREVRQLHPAGEGGEYETLVVDMPPWARRLELDETETVGSASHSRLVVRRARLVPKSSATGSDASQP